MKILGLFFCSMLILCSCSSSESLSQEESVDRRQLPTRVKARVEIKDADGNLKPIPGSHQTAGWVDSTKYGRMEGRELRSLTVDQIIAKLASANPYYTTIIIEELKSRRIKGVKALAHILDDKRVAVFSGSRQYWWYEKKNAPVEPVELRIYAAYTLQFILKKYPSDVVMDMTREQLIFATKGKYAVTKDDLSAVWKEWWRQNKNDY